jgi:hypothetical protein
MIKKLLLYIFICLASATVFAQKSNTKNSPITGNYLGISGGLAFGSMRDQSTSPLFYTAFMPTVAIDYDAYCKKNLWNLKFTTLNGFYLLTTDDDLFSGSGNIFDFEFAWYRNYESSSDGMLNQFLGTSITNSTHLRINNAFMNASFALNNFTDFNLNFRIEKQYNRPEKQKKFLWLIKYMRKEKHYLLSGKIGVPVYTIIYRPGYTNPGNGTLNDDQLLSGYEMSGKVFGGINSDLSISRLLKNGNMIKYSYLWNMRTTGRMSENPVDITNHVFLFTLVYKIN